MRVYLLPISHLINLTSSDPRYVAWIIGTLFDFVVDSRGASSLARALGDHNLEPYVTLGDPT